MQTPAFLIRARFMLNITTRGQKIHCGTTLQPQ